MIQRGQSKWKIKNKMQKREKLEKRERQFKSAKVLKNRSNSPTECVKAQAIPAVCITNTEESEGR